MAGTKMTTGTAGWTRESLSSQAVSNIGGDAFSIVRAPMGFFHGAKITLRRTK